MGFRVTLLLALAALGLFAVLQFTDQKPAAKVAAESSLLDGRSLRECRVLRWQIENYPWIEITLDPEVGFRMTEPIVDLASAAFLRQILAAWDTAQVVATQFADDEAGRGETGLVEPAATFVAQWPDGRKLQVDVGATAIAKDERFLRRDGRIYRGSAAVYESLRVGFDDLRERAVFQAMEPSCHELVLEQATLTGKRETLHFVRKNGDWHLQAPRSGRADQHRARLLVTAVLSLRADHFLSGPMRPPGREPDLLILVRSSFGEQVARLWTEQGQVFGQMPGRNVSFNADNRQYGQIFDNAAQDFRATLLLSMHSVAEQCGQVLLDPGQGRGDRIRLRRDSEAKDWRLQEPIEYRVGATPMNELLQGLNNLRAIEFVDGKTAKDPELGLQAGRLQVGVVPLEGRETTTLWIGASTERNGIPLVYACRADDPETVVLVPQPAVDMLQRPFWIYCQREVLNLTVPIERMVMRAVAATGLKDREWVLRDSRWFVDGAGEARDEVTGLVQDVLRELRARSCVDLRNDPYGQPDWEVDLCRENGDVLVSLQVWDRGKDAPFVVRPVVKPVAAGPLGFALEPFVAKALRELWQ